MGNMSSHIAELTDAPELLMRAERDALKKRVEILRGMTPETRLRIGMELYELGVALVVSGYRSVHQNATQDEIQAELRRRLLPGGLRQKLEAYLEERQS